MIVDLIKENFSKLLEVEAIVLAGSRTINTEDEFSDYDFYIYTNEEISISKREEIIAKFSDNTQINNTFWETEDISFLKDGKTGVELIYRSYEWIEDIIKASAEENKASMGYTTCFWSNLQSSKILFDRTGRLTKLQEKYNIAYPQELKENIVKQNLPLLRERFCAYSHQIKKAVKRLDYISINHRFAGFLESYFDIIFAINEILHLGEKKLAKLLKEKAKKLPNNMEGDINTILASIISKPEIISEKIEEMVDNLELLLKEENLI